MEDRGKFQVRDNVAAWLKNHDVSACIRGKGIFIFVLPFLSGPILVKNVEKS